MNLKVVNYIFTYILILLRVNIWILFFLYYYLDNGLHITLLVYSYTGFFLVNLLKHLDLLMYAKPIAFLVDSTNMH